MFNTKAFITALTNRVNELLPTYYEEAVTTRVKYPYAVISGLNVIDADGCDLASFYIDIWADEKEARATEQLENACDILRNGLTNCVINEAGIFACHIGFENQNIVADNEYDIAHRRIGMSARIFYN